MEGGDWCLGAIDEKLVAVVEVGGSSDPEKTV